MTTDPASVYKKNLMAAYKPAVAAPHADQKIHRHQHHFPENIKKEEVERHENAEHACLQHEQQNVVFLGAQLDGAPGRKNGDHAEECGEHDQEKADAIDAQGIFRADAGNPVGGFAEVVAIAADREMHHQRNGNEEPEQAEQIADQPVSELRAARDEHQKQRAHKRREEDHAQKMI